MADFWADIIKSSILDNTLNESLYLIEYRKRIPKLNKGERIIKISQFYMVSLLTRRLDKTSEESFVNYINESQINTLPRIGDKKGINQYIKAVKLICKYQSGKEKLIDTIKYLKDNNIDVDMG